MAAQVIHASEPPNTGRGRVPLPPSIARLVWVFARFGNTVFGGGTPTIMVLERQIVDHHRWLDGNVTRLVFGISRLTPGTNLLAFCAGIGWLTRGWPGAVAALVAASLPCSIAAVALTAFYRSWASHDAARLALQGALACAVAIMVATCWTLVRPHWQRDNRLFVTVMFVAAFAGASLWGLSPLWVLAFSGLVGACWLEREDA